MGLDDFNSDKDTDKESKEEKQNDEETTTETEASGIEAFRTDDSSGESPENDDKVKIPPWIEDFSAYEWNNMDEGERVRYVRKHYVDDYRPSYQIDNRWKYNRVIEIYCVCDTSFTFRSKGVCFNCGRTYKKEGRTVVKVYEPDDNNKDGNEADSFS